MNHKFIFLLSFFLAAIFCFPSQVLFAQDQTDARAAIGGFLDQIREMEFPVKDAANHSIKIEKAARYLDLQAMAEKSLGKNWSVMTTAEKTEFMALFWKLIESIAYPRTQKFLGNQKIIYSEAKPIDRGVEVSSSVRDTEAELDVPIVYHLYLEGTQWKIYDIFMDGVSMTEDLQYQFDKMIQDGSIQALIDRMKERLVQAQKEISGN